MLKRWLKQNKTVKHYFLQMYTCTIQHYYNLNKFFGFGFNICSTFLALTVLLILG